MSERELGQFLLLLALLFGATYLLFGILERMKIPGILGALLIAMGAHYTFVGELISQGVFYEAFTMLAELGVLFLLFFIGLQIDTKAMRSQSGNIILSMVVVPLLFSLIVSHWKGALLSSMPERGKASAKKAASKKG